jgi:hypothetical protein
MLAVFAKVDVSGLNAAIAWRQREAKSSRTMRQVVCTSASEVAIKAQIQTPYVKQSTIDTELAVRYTPGYTSISADGFSGKMTYAKRNRLARGGISSIQRTRRTGSNAVPLAALIIQASTRYGSRYNELTNYRYFRAKSPFAGVSRQQGRMAMVAEVNRMIRARHSSTNFLQAGWSFAIQALAGETAKRSKKSVNYASRHTDKAMGRVVITDQGDSASCLIESNPGAQSVNARSWNEALWRYGAPALQRAVDDEAAKMVEYVQKKIEAQTAKMNQMLA